MSDKIVKLLFESDINPEIIIEPTCGKGSFILSAIKQFNNIKKVYGIEIYKPYVWETKLSILEFYLQNLDYNKPEISIIHSSIFDYNFKKLSTSINKQELLILGNPPWVTNSKLSQLNSQNLPTNANVKNQSGMDALTGKSNFDIAEFITIMLIEAFQEFKGHIALLVKNIVIKNILQLQKTKNYKISKIDKYTIDSKKEFNAAVDASLFKCSLDDKSNYICSDIIYIIYSIYLISVGLIQSLFPIYPII